MGEAGGVSFAAESAIVICLESFAGGFLSASADKAGHGVSRLQGGRC